MVKENIIAAEAKPRETDKTENGFFARRAV